jgi:hypothetical protein
MVLRRNERLKTGGIPGLAVAANPSGGTSFPFEFTQADPHLHAGGRQRQHVLKLTDGSPFTSTVAANGGQVMQMVVIPEPSAAAILAGAGIAAVMLRRRHA